MSFMGKEPVMNVGDRVSYYHDTGAMGSQLCYGEVIKIGAKKIKVRDEWGGEGWRYPWFFNEWHAARDACPDCLSDPCKPACPSVVS